MGCLRPPGAERRTPVGIRRDARGEWRFRLKAGNGEIVATGESYPTKQGVEQGIEAVKRAAAEGDVREAA
ncbi:YegP family protein [Kitasatospora sp. NPDC051164]|uniref:YegP family protein n=1 Tax=Kitasatospora sp. NPDC051164 TaxID=3364055 RepID=UPI00379015F2